MASNNAEAIRLLNAQIDSYRRALDLAQFKVVTLDADALCGPLEKIVAQLQAAEEEGA